MRTSESGEQASVFRFGEFTFDDGSHLLLRGRIEQHLSPKARQLLHLLLLNRSRAVSRKELYDALWPATFVCETNLSSVISELRRALDDTSGRFIRTVHGFGYSFAGEVSLAQPRPVAAAMMICDDERHPLYDGENSVGRALDCSIVLTDPTVSRHHAVIFISHDEITVQDLRSKNGTYVGDQRITRAVVRDHEPILFGAALATIARKLSGTLTLPFGALRRRSRGIVDTA